LGTDVPALSVAVGADVIEKHFTINSSLDGPDHEMSIEPDELATLVDEVRNVEEILGDGTIRCIDAEKDTIQFRKETN